MVVKDYSLSQRLDYVHIFMYFIHFHLRKQRDPNLATAGAAKVENWGKQVVPVRNTELV